MITHVADYEVVRSLGSGAQGESFLAVAPARLALDGDRVVVKLLSHTADDEVFKRVTSELRFVASVSSPHLVRLYDVGHQAGLVYYAEEFCEGGSLANPTRPLDRAAVLRVLAGAARGAHALHEAGAAHRAIKPANVMIDAEGEGRLGDPGLSGVVSPGQTTTGGDRVISLEFIEPGVLRGESAGRASDIWALGATAHRALAGQPLYDGLETRDVAAAIRLILTSVPEVAASLSDREAEVVRSCLAEERSDRPSTALEVAEAFDDLVNTAKAAGAAP